jgi:hypothetical protein
MPYDTVKTGRSAMTASNENPGAPTPIGKAVRARKDVPAYLFLGGWGDGWDLLHSGALIYMVEVEGDLIRFLAGPEPPGPLGTFRTGGLIHISRFRDFEEL